MSLARNTALGDTRAAKKGERIVFSTNRTCFYAEQGGQVSDTGWMSTATGRFHVDSVRRVTASMDLSDGPRLVQFFSHSGEVTEGEISIGQECVLRVSPEHRLPTMKNHTATHILNWALREILDPAGEHLQQKGSLVDPDKTRFDFSHNKPLAEDELERIEALCAAKIEENLTVYTNADEPVEKERALKLGQSLRAVFGEAYPDRVRVVSIGVPVTPEEAAKEGRSDSLLADPDNPEWRKYSIEFCGGTHVKSTGEIERFVLTHEEAVAKGVRRVVGVSGARARIVQEIGAALELEAAGLRNAERAELEPGVARLQKKFAQAHELPLLSRHRLREALARLQERVRQFHRADAAQAQDVVMDRVRELLASAERVGETTVLVAEMPDVPIDQLKTGADAVKQKCGSAAVLFGACVDRDTNPPGKAVLLAAMSDDLTKRGLKAGDLVKEVAKLVQGGGGGPPTMAQAGGKDPSKLAEALDAGRAWILAKLK
jgi:alanyl-tRNA synthetase